jgi:hypothetical protein
MRIIFVAAAGALALTGCQPAAQQNAAENTAAELDAIGNGEGEANAAANVQATVLGMSDKMRNGVLLRAIMDSEMPCDGVERADRLPDQEGSPTWKAYCRNGSKHIVIFQRDGIAKVLSPTGI